MDAVEFARERNRICKAFGRSCRRCPIGLTHDVGTECAKFFFERPEYVTGIVERWAKQNPVKTRQSEFLKQWPDAERYCSGALSVCPKSVDRNLKLDCSRPCDKCCSQFWLEEIE